MSQQDTFTQGLIAGMQMGQNARRQRSSEEQASLEAAANDRYREGQLGLGRERNQMDREAQRERTIHNMVLEQQGLIKIEEARTKAAEHLGELEQERNASVAEWGQFNPEPATGTLIPSASTAANPEWDAWSERKQVFSRLDTKTRQSILSGHRKQADAAQARKMADLKLQAYATTGAAGYMDPSVISRALEQASPEAAQKFLESLPEAARSNLANVRASTSQGNAEERAAAEALQTGDIGIQWLQERVRDTSLDTQSGQSHPTPMANAARRALYQAYNATGDVRLLPERADLAGAVATAQKAILDNRKTGKETELYTALTRAKKALSDFDASYTRPQKPATAPTRPQEQPGPQTSGNASEPPRGGTKPSPDGPQASQEPPEDLAATLAQAIAANPQQPGEPEDAYKARIKALLGAPR